METLSIETPDIEEIVEIRAMNDWMREASEQPVPKQLFDDLWREGELAILFEDTGKGKSALAVQIGESIARGRPFFPFGMTAKPRNVLLLDFEMSEKQIEMRYSADQEPDKPGPLKKKYSFSKRFHRVVVRPEILYRNSGEPLENVLRELLQPLIVKTGASVLIIDNITHLKRTAESYRETVPLMKELQRLRRRFGLSILVIAHTRKRDAKRGIAINDLQSAGMLSKSVDNVFAIGQSRRHASERYIKHLKPRNAEALYDASHVPVFRLAKIGGNFLGLEFKEFSSEKALLLEPKESPVWPLIEEIKQMHDEKIPIRAIADKLGLSKTAAHRYLQMWHPPAETAAVQQTRDEIFPGANDYFDAMDELSDADESYEDEDDWEEVFRTREYEIIENALDNATREYKRTGTAPKLEDSAEYNAFQEAVRAFYISAGEVVQEPIRDLVEDDDDDDPVTAKPVARGRPVATGEWQGPLAAPFLYDKTPYAKAWLRHLGDLHPDRNPAEIRNDYRLGETWCRPPGSIPPYDPEDPFGGMRIELEAGNTIYIEHEFKNGTPRVWYKYERDILYRLEHDGICGISRSRANPNLFGRFVKRE